MKPSKIWKGWLAYPLAVLAMACWQSENVASTEILNPPGKGTVTGIVTDPFGKPAARVLVQAFPVDYNPINDIRFDTIQKMVDTTDSLGKFTIAQLDSGEYNLVAKAQLGGMAALVRDFHIHSKRTLNLGHPMLHHTGALSILIPDSFPREKGFLALMGTSFRTSVDLRSQETRRVQLDSLPIGRMPPLIYSTQSASAPIQELAREVLIQSDDTLPADAYSAWRYHKRIFINTRGSGTGNSGTVKDCPILIRLQAGDIDFNLAQASGNDLRFTSKNGTALAYDLEDWNSTYTRATIWVKLDSVLGNDSTQFIRMYWGNAKAISESSGPVVFSKNRGYLGVWHLNEVPNITKDGYQDASGNLNHGTGTAMPTYPRIASLSGYAQAFDGMNTSINAGTGPSLHAPSALTLEAWVRVTTFGYNANLISKAYTTDSVLFYEYGLTLGNPSNTIRFTITAAGINRDLNTTQTLLPNEWYQVAGTYDGAFMRVFINGSLTDSLAFTGAISDFGRPLLMGRYEYSTAFSLDGILDEVRVLRVAHGKDYFKLTYENLKASSKLIRFDTP
jgi:hypothetical protein